MTAATLKQAYRQSDWLKKLGKISFVFFAVKGVLWLVAPLVFYYMI